MLHHGWDEHWRSFTKAMSRNVIAEELIRIVQDQFALDCTGIHGLPHWRRVRENGLQLADVTGANREVVELFAFLHDSQRTNEGYDTEHAAKAAEYVKTLAGSVLQLDAPLLNSLITACRWHSNGLSEGNVTVLTCWDADRLDLGRVGIKPRPDRLCTEAARDPRIIEAAYRRSLERGR